MTSLLPTELPIETLTTRELPRNWTMATAGAVAATLLLAMVLFIANSARRTERPLSTAALMDDFDHFVRESQLLQIVSADAKEVCDWLRYKTALAVNLPVIGPATGTLMGGRKCKINGTPAAFAVYRVGEELISVVAVRESDQSLATMKRIGQSHWVDHDRGYTVLACRRGELLYAVVSRIPEEVSWALWLPVDGE